jgi:4-aminobutyrate aminotransferase/(S)-3-amino-2-methylpropionate transaminase
VEPIQAEGGDNEASPEFFQGLQKITRKVINHSALNRTVNTVVASEDKIVCYSSINYTLGLYICHF